MELSLLLMKQILSMALMILMGFTVVRAGILKTEQSSVLSALVIYLIAPCTEISAFQVEYNSDRLQGLVIATVAAAIAHLIFITLSRIFGDLLKLSSVERASMIYSNGANLIIPLVSALLGEDMVFYTCAFIAVQNTCMWTHGVCLMNKREKPSVKKILLNPNMIAIIAGAIMFFARISLPPIVDTTVANVAASLGAVCMFMIGMVMGGVNFKEAFSKLRLYGVCFGRLIAYPMIFIFLISLSGITRRIPEARQVLMITTMAACAPVAVSVTQFANLWGEGDDPKDAGSINVMSVLFCIVTMPFIIWIYQIIC